MLFASFFNWFFSELFRSIFLLSAGVACLLVVVVLLLYFAAEKSTFTSLSEDDSEDSANESQLGINVDSDDPMLRKDLPEKHRFRSMLLTKTPVGKDSLETQQILQKLVGKEYNSELHWALYPPCGPRPRAVWEAPSISLSGDKPTTVYIIKFPVECSNGSTIDIFKPGITSRKVVGASGRYSRTFNPEVVYERLLTPVKAWMVEQKLLQVMPANPFDRSFEDWVEHWQMWEDMISALPDAGPDSRVTYRGKDDFKVMAVRDEIMRIEEDNRLKSGREFDWSKIKCAKYDSLGPTEWRIWPYSLDSLIHAAEDIVRCTLSYEE